MEIFFLLIFSLKQFPDCDSDEDDEFKSADAVLKTSIPFAIVGGTHTLDVQGKKVRERSHYMIMRCHHYVSML